MSGPNYGPRFNPSPAMQTGYYANPANRGKSPEEIEAGMFHPADWTQALADPALAGLGHDDARTNYLRSMYGLGGDYKVQNGQLVSANPHPWLIPAIAAGAMFAPELVGALGGLGGGGAAAGSAAGGLTTGAVAPSMTTAGAALAGAAVPGATGAGMSALGGIGSALGGWGNLLTGGLNLFGNLFGAHQQSNASTQAAQFQAQALQQAAAINAQAQMWAAMTGGNAQEYAARLAANSANYGASLGHQNTLASLGFMQDAATNAFQNNEASRHGNYDMWAAQQRRLGSLGESLGYGAREIPNYVAGVAPTFRQMPTPTPMPTMEPPPQVQMPPGFGGFPGMNGLSGELGPGVMSQMPPGFGGLPPGINGVPGGLVNGRRPSVGNYLVPQQRVVA